MKVNRILIIYVKMKKIYLLKKHSYFFLNIKNINSIDVKNKIKTTYIINIKKFINRRYDI